LADQLNDDRLHKMKLTRCEVMKELYEEHGMSVARLRRLFKLSRSGAHRCLAKVGTKMRPRHRHG
jgi:hypothetical protein